MSKAIYLAVKVSKLPSDVPPDDALLNWCLRSFEFRANPIPDIRFELRSVWGHDLLVFYRESPNAKPEITPLDLPDEILEGFIDSAEDEGKMTADEFKKRFLLLIRLDAALAPTGEPRVIPLTAHSALGTANLYVRGLRNFDSRFDQKYLNPPLFHLYNNSSDTFWCIIPDTNRPDEVPEPSEDPTREFAKKTDLGTFLKPKEEKK